MSPYELAWRLARMWLDVQELRAQGRGTESELDVLEAGIAARLLAAEHEIAARELALLKCRKTANDRVIARLTERAEILQRYGPRRKPCCYASRRRAPRTHSTAPRQRRARRTRQAPRGDPDPYPEKERARPICTRASSPECIPENNDRPTKPSVDMHIMHSARSGKGGARCPYV